MKLKNFFFAAIAAAFAFAACEPADPDTGTGNTGGNTGGDNQGGSSDVVETQTGFTGAGDYWIVAGDVVATTVRDTYTSGYLPVVDVWKSSDAYSTAEANKYTFAEVEGGYTIQDNFGRYLYVDDTHTSFQLSAEPTEGHVWKVTVQDNGTCTITNVLITNYVQYSVSHTSFGAYTTAQDNALLPKLVSVFNPIEAISIDTAPVQFSADGETKTLTATVPEGTTLSVISDNNAFSASVDGAVVSLTAASSTEAQEGTLTVTFANDGYSIVKQIPLTQAAPPTANEKTVTVQLGQNQNWVTATSSTYGAGVKVETTDFVIEHYKNTSSNEVVTSYPETRIYVGHIFMITPKNGGTIKSVSFTSAGGKNGPLEIGGIEYTATNGVLSWTGSVSTFSAVGKSQLRTTQMVVVYE